jgi:hypothetical protein
VPTATLPIADSTAATPLVPDPPVTSPKVAAPPTTVVETEFVRPEVESAPERQAPRATAAAALTQARVGDTSVSPASLSPPLPVSELPPERAVPSTPEPKASAASSVEPVPESRTAPAAAMPHPVAEASPGDERLRVRAALGRYEAGYSSLNVDSVRAVWPGVDARSLGRAFDGLASQRVSLGQCSISVAAITARADCRGQATWAPRIGGGRETADRTWSFDLRNVAGAWQIVRVQAR